MYLHSLIETGIIGTAALLALFIAGFLSRQIRAPENRGRGAP